MQQSSLRNLLILPLLLLATSPSLSAEKNAIQEASPTSSITLGLQEARKKILADRPYKANRFERAPEVKLSIAPVTLKTESIPDWWSEKQGYDISKVLENAMSYYPGISLIPGKTWEEMSVQQELGAASSETPSKKQSHLLGKKKDENIRLLKPEITNYQFQVFKPKKRGVGLIFIAITSKSCKTESFISFRNDFIHTTESSKKQGLSSTEILGQVFDVSRLLNSESGGTSLNLNAIVAGAGGGDFKPPERVTKELLYEAVVDIAEGTYCVLTNNKDCISYYNSRKQDKPTPPKRDKSGKIIKLKVEQLKC
jgi:hypothetical protein